MKRMFILTVITIFMLSLTGCTIAGVGSFSDIFSKVKTTFSSPNYCML